MLHAPNGVFVARENELDLSNFIHSTIYPNPFSGQATLRLDLEKSETLDISLLDLHGRKLSQLAFHKKFNAGTHSMELNGEGMSPGIYLLTITNEKSRLVQKLVVGN